MPERDTEIRDFLKRAFAPGTRVLVLGEARMTAGQWAECSLDPDFVSLDALGSSTGDVSGGVAEGAVPDQYSKLPLRAAAVWCPDEASLSSGSPFNVAFALRNRLTADARLLVRWPVTTMNTPAAEFTLLLERIGFRAVDQWPSVSLPGNPVFLLYRLSSAAGSRAIDRIESVLSRDRKVATYKLALVRALAEIALTEYRSVRWLSETRVAVPLSRIAERWLFYYWPLFAHAQFIPQVQGETTESSRPVAFRRALTTLADSYRKMGGMTGFHRAFSSEDPGSREKSVKDVLRTIEDTILTGPVAHAGGRASPVFSSSRDGRERFVIVPADIWTELTLLGRWVTDAVKLRWAEKTRELADGKLNTAAVLDLLLETPGPERDTSVARRLFMPKQGEMVCVWSGKPIRESRLAVDHLMPYSLWGNNDLWNLLPTDRDVNAQKSDKLPTTDQLVRSRSRLQDCWYLLHERHAVRFDREMRRVTGSRNPSSSWAEGLFEFVLEAVELTAAQTAAERWEHL